MCDPTRDLVDGNIGIMRDFYEEGIKRAYRALMTDKPGLAREILAEPSFHPMWAEAWPGWPDDRTAQAGSK